MSQPGQTNSTCIHVVLVRAAFSKSSRSEKRDDRREYRTSGVQPRLLKSCCKHKCAYLSFTAHAFLIWFNIFPEVGLVYNIPNIFGTAALVSLGSSATCG